MSENGILKRFRDFMHDLQWNKSFASLDFVVLKSLMMLAAVDGEVSTEEIALFRQLSEKCSGYNEESFAKLWDNALRSAGKLLILSKVLKEDELVDAFVNEAECGFVEELSLGLVAERESAFACLESLAAADGARSRVESRCIAALKERVTRAHDEAIRIKYSRATVFG